MGDPSKSSMADTNTDDAQPSLSVKDFCKTYKSLLHKWHSDAPNNRHNFNISAPTLLSQTVTTKATPITPRRPFEISPDDFTISTPVLIVRTTSYLNPIPAGSSIKLSKISSKQTSTNPLSIDDDEELHISSPTLLARATSRITGGQLLHASTGSSRNYVKSPRAEGTDNSNGSNDPKPSTAPKIAIPVMTTPIFFSQSGPRRQPPPVEKKLECSLEELCFGCVKKINITRDVLASNGLIIQEQEVLSIKLQPGWQKGTKIIFKEKGDERPGSLPADIVFEIEEKRHRFYNRRGDNDLELQVEILLIDALTGCKISVPLLGGHDYDLTIEDVIYPGYETTIPGQGMPRLKEPWSRGDLRLKFMVEFPGELSKEQRAELASVLEE